MISSGSRQPSLNRMPSSQNSPSGEVSPASRSFSSGFAGNSDNMSPAAPSAGAHPEGEHISNPIAVRHDLKVEYDSFNARYKGLPSAWESMNKSFGLPYEMSQKVAVEGYESRIPATLEMLKRYFLQYEGQNAVGVFRLSANKDEVDLAKQQIDTGQFNGCEDVHIIANLIKVCLTPRIVLVVTCFIL